MTKHAPIDGLPCCIFSGWGLTGTLEGTAGLPVKIRRTIAFAGRGFFRVGTFRKRGTWQLDHFAMT